MTRVTVTEFTDPYCTWCWGAEPIVRRLREVYRDQLRVEYAMGGLVEDFSEFHDPTNDIERADEVAPHWVTASHRHGMPVEVSLWEEDPPTSTYPANVAYKAAEFQDRELAHGFLRRMREAAATETANLEREAVVSELAAEVGLDVDRFERAIASGRAEQAFEEDLERTRKLGATSLPTFVVDVDGDRELLRGYRPFVTFEKLFTEEAPDLVEYEPRPIPDLVEEYGRMATQEVAEIHELSRDEAKERLVALEADGLVVRKTAGTGLLWETT